MADVLVRVLGGLLGGVLVLTLVDTAEARPDVASRESQFSWSVREEARNATDDTELVWHSGEGRPDGIRSWGDATQELQLRASNAREGVALRFRPPLGQSVSSGSTYRVHALQPTRSLGHLVVERGELVCGENDGPWRTASHIKTPLLNGTIRIDEVVPAPGGGIEKLRATYDVGCLRTDGPLGFAGSVVVGSDESAMPLPRRLEPPGPVTNVRVVNRLTGRGGFNSTDLSWTRGAGSVDTIVDFVEHDDPAAMSPILANYVDGTWAYDGPGQHLQTDIDFMARRVWRISSRGPTGRLGTPVLLPVGGTRMSSDSVVHGTAGKPVDVGGRLNEAWDHEDPDDVMNGPPIRDAHVRLCQYGAKPVRSLEDCRTVATTRTGDDGTFNFRVLPSGTTRYSLVYEATPERLGNDSDVIAVEMAPETDLRVETPVAGERSTSVRMTSSRARLGAKGTVSLQRLDGSRWRTVATKQLGDGRGRASFTVERVAGQQFRAVKPGDRRHVGGVSRVVRLR